MELNVQKWQYLRDDVEALEEADEKLLYWGDRGWELVAVVPYKHPVTKKDIFVLFLKSPGLKDWEGSRLTETLSNS